MGANSSTKQGVFAHFVMTKLSNSKFVVTLFDLSCNKYAQVLSLLLLSFNCITSHMKVSWLYTFTIASRTKFSIECCHMFSTYYVALKSIKCLANKTISKNAKVEFSQKSNNWLSFSMRIKVKIMPRTIVINQIFFRNNSAMKITEIFVFIPDCVRWRFPDWWF